MTTLPHCTIEHHSVNAEKKSYQWQLSDDIDECLTHTCCGLAEVWRMKGPRIKRPRIVIQLSHRGKHHTWNIDCSRRKKPYGLVYCVILAKRFAREVIEGHHS